MFDLDNAKVQPRLKDKASQHNLGLLDRIRSWRVLRNQQIEAGKNVVFKKGISISICETGSLQIGDDCMFKDDSLLLLTMPEPKVVIGKNCTFGMNTIIASKSSITIGDFTNVAPNCYIIDHEHGFSGDDLVSNQRSVLKSVSIGRDCFLGTGTIIVGGSVLEDGAVIGAGSVVTGRIPAYEIWAGNPARFIKKRPTSVPGESADPSHEGTTDRAEADGDA